MSMHDGHRKRLRDRFIQEGLDNFQDINVLELLLFYCIPRVDTNPIAHKLLDTFGSFPGVLEATVEELQKVEGIGENAATFLSLLNATNRFYNVKKTMNKKCIATVDDYIQYFEPLFIGRTNERLYLMCLDAKSNIISCKLISEGTATASEISPRKVMEHALNANAASIILAHNHPSGSAMPSIDDIRVTKNVHRATSGLSVILVDHVVYGAGEHVSMVRDLELDFSTL